MRMQSVTLLYFGDLMSRLMIGRETLRLPSSVHDIGGLMRLLALRGGEWQKAFGAPRPTLRITVNKNEASPETPLAGGDEVAFIEAVSL